ncbi:MAG: threonylcarbamoyl-AMP synthase [Gemmataceae bacterium]
MASIVGPEGLEQAAETLRRGGLVAFPTETVYGLGACVWDERAIARIFEVKGRPRFDPLIVHVSNEAMRQACVAEWPERAQQLADRFWPGPLTLVVVKSAQVPDLVTAGLPTVALRMPAHPLALALIEKTGAPIAAPSANRFGRPSPTCAEHVVRQLGGDIDLILDGGPCTVGVESTVLSLVDTPPAVLRPGGVPLEALEQILGPVQKSWTAAEPSGLPKSPGQLPRHYAPRTPLQIVTDPHPIPGRRTGLLAFTMPRDTEGFAHVEVLSARGDLREAAARLFAALHRLDEADLDIILAQPVPEMGLGVAIMDRLRRAAHMPQS